MDRHLDVVFIADRHNSLEEIFEVIKELILVDILSKHIADGVGVVSLLSERGLAAAALVNIVALAAVFGRRRLVHGNLVG